MMLPTDELHALLDPHLPSGRQQVPWASVIAELRRRSAARVQPCEVAVRTETLFESHRHPSGVGWLLEPRELLSVVVRPVGSARTPPPVGTGASTSAADLGLSPVDIAVYRDACALMQHITSTLNPLHDCVWTQLCWDFQDRLRPVRDALRRQILDAARDGPWRRRRHLAAVARL